MRRASTLAAGLAAAAGLLLADAASAQSDPRLLSWPGRGEATLPASGATGAPTPASRDLRRPNPVIPHGGAAAVQPAPRGLTPAPGPVRHALTPANAWLRPPAPAPAPVPAPVTAPVSAPPSAPAPARPGPEYLPDQGGRGQPAPAAIVYPAPPPPAEAAGAVPDPMAPRRDAPIFRIQQTPPPVPPGAQAAATPAADAPPTPRTMQAVRSAEGPPRAQGGRYYSVHRLNGRDPDPLVIPDPTYVDGLVVSDIETLASQDLAVPQEGPTLIRDRNGNLRAAPAPSDGDHQ